MARGTSFIELITMLRAELRRSVNPAVGVEDIPELKRLIIRNYEMLVLDHDWPHLLQLTPLVQLQAGENLYDFPDGFDYERIKSISAWFSGLPLNIERGISFEDYAISNPANGSRSSPVLKWDIRYGDGVQPQVEVWPVPASSNQYQLQWFCHRSCPRLVNDADQCLLDDNLVVLGAAAESLAASGAKDAQAKAAAFKHHYDRLKGRSANSERQISIGQGVPKRMLSTRAIVVVRG
jgi:hypothetical protein